MYTTFAYQATLHSVAVEGMRSARAAWSCIVVRSPSGSGSCGVTCLWKSVSISHSVLSTVGAFAVGQFL